MLDRLFPRQVDNRFDGHRAALWFLGAFVFVKLAMSTNSIINTARIVTGDGIPLESFGPAAAEQVLLLFALMALGQLTLALVALIILIRYRALVPLICLLLLAERIAGRLIIQSYSGLDAASPLIVWIMAVLLPALLAFAVVFSLIPSRRGGGGAARASTEEGQ